MNYKISYLDVGECNASGFYCEDCVIKEVKKSEHIIYVDVNPENTPYYKCDMCGKDYRD